MEQYFSTFRLRSAPICCEAAAIFAQGDIAGDEASQQWKLLQTPGAFNSGKNLANVSKNVVLTPVGGLGDDAYYLAVSDQVGLVVGSAYKVAVYQHGPLGPKQTAERTLAGKIVPRL